MNASDINLETEKKKYLQDHVIHFLRLKSDILDLIGRSSRP
jgi:hypothetical protein